MRSPACTGAESLLIRAATSAASSCAVAGGVFRHSSAGPWSTGTTLAASQLEFLGVLGLHLAEFLLHGGVLPGAEVAHGAALAALARTTAAGGGLFAADRRLAEGRDLLVELATHADEAPSSVAEPLALGGVAGLA
ncbi:unnamed protein product [Prorocentrum cordatum]|uniref:Uncharacterized protein n=1 Tax=Prorocentrum cordatum TaxID=2364126 RepID=A0ABN9X255_9DINO|nr:unnamed protein product [Polarella glacialis]